MKKSVKISLFIALLLIIDQIIKILVKTNMSLNDSIHIFDWFQIHFVENPGMAFGMKFGGTFGKTILTLFRLIVSGLVLYYIILLIKDNYKTSYLICVSLIFVGAIGNIVDCLFYGLIFDTGTVFDTVNQYYVGYQGISSFSTQGYASLLQGCVVDMFYFPLFTFPDWLPLLGGEIFFSPVFNIADSCITVGIFILIIFFRKDFNITFDRYFQRVKR